MRNEIKIYSPKSDLAEPLKLLRSMMQGLNASRELSWRLAIRDISAQYRQSFLGVLWALIIPFTNTLIWLFLSSSNVLKVADTSLPYPVYVFSGSLLWSILIESLIAPLQQVERNREMISKMYFPRESIILSGIYQTLFNAFIKIGILIIALPFFKIHPNITGIFIPLGILSLILAGTVIGLIFTPIGILYQDVGRGIPLISQFLMYLSPVVYPLSTNGVLGKIMTINPLTPLIINARAWFTGEPNQYLTSWFVSNLFFLVLGFFLWTIFRLAMPILIERMSA